MIKKNTNTEKGINTFILNNWIRKCKAGNKVYFHSHLKTIKDYCIIENRIVLSFSDGTNTFISGLRHITFIFSADEYEMLEAGGKITDDYNKEVNHE